MMKTNRLVSLGPLTVCAAFLAALACNSSGRSVGDFESSASGSGGGSGDGSGSDGGGDGDGDGDAGSGGDGDGDGESGSGGDGDGDGDGDSGGIRLDVSGDSAGSGGEGGLGEGCEKVDFLFIVDNSVSMGDEQQNLSRSFPGFMDTIQQQVVEDYHVMVIDTDPEDKWEEELAECPGRCAGEPPDEPCGILSPQNMWTCGNLPTGDACGPQLGAGIDHDGSTARNSCNIAGGKRWFDDSEADPAATFDCVANLHAGNSPELTMGGMLAALDPAMVGPGGCNEGFLRDDAVLVVTFISDEEDAGDSPGNPASWRSELLARKGGNETGVVVLGLLGDTGLPGAVCPPDSQAGSNGGEYSPNLIEFAESWGARGLWGSVCAPDYGPFFEQAVALVKTACDDFVPPG